MAKSALNMMADALSTPKTEKTAAAAAGKTAAAKGKTAPAEGEATVTKKEKPPKEEGPKEIKTCNDLLKAIWSSRGAVYAPIKGFDFSLAIVKSDLTTILKNGDLNAAAPFNLVQRPNNGGADLVPMTPAKK